MLKLGTDFGKKMLAPQCSSSFAVRFDLMQSAFDRLPQAQFAVFRGKNQRRSCFAGHRIYDQWQKVDESATTPFLVAK